MRFFTTAWVKGATVRKSEKRAQPRDPRAKGHVRGDTTCPASNFADSTDTRVFLSRSGFTAMTEHRIAFFNSSIKAVPTPQSSIRIFNGLCTFAKAIMHSLRVG